MEKLKAYYFTGTGNTRYVTEKLCGYLQDRYDTETFDVTKTASVSSADLLLFAFPVYGSSPPKPMVRFVLNNAQKIRGQECIVIATQYKFSGDGAASLGRLLEKTGAKVSFAEHFNMPNNLSDCAMFKIRNGARTQRYPRKSGKKGAMFRRPYFKGQKISARVQSPLPFRRLCMPAEMVAERRKRKKEQPANRRAEMRRLRVMRGPLSRS